MTLASAQVKSALATRITGLASTGSRVFKSRAWPLAEADLPAWKVVTQGEEITAMTVHDPVLQMHTLQIDLQGVAKAVDLLDDLLDTLALEACLVLFNPPAAGDALTELEDRIQFEITGIERAMQGDAEAVLGLVTLSVQVQFRTYRTDPETIAL